LAVILLLASQYSFQWFRKQEEDALEITAQEPTPEETEIEPEEEPIQNQSVPLSSVYWPFPSATFNPVPSWGTTPIHTEEVPSETQPTALGGDITAPEEKLVETVEDLPLEQWNKMIEAAEQAVAKEKTPEEILDEGLSEPNNLIFPENPDQGDRVVMLIDHTPRNFIFNGSSWVNADLSDPGAVSALDELKKKSSYIIKDHNQQIKKTKE